MYKIRVFFRQKGVHLLDHINNYSTSNGQPFRFEKCLVFSKFSRYEYERQALPQYNDAEFQKILRSKGADFDLWLDHQKINIEFQTNVAETLKNMGIETRIINRMTCTKDSIDWADVLMPIGGDGTFLLAASKIKNTEKPVIGFNSDPSSSEGYLCVPKKYSTDIRGAIERLQAGHFSWLMRSRIRTTLIGRRPQDKPTDLHQVAAENLYDIEGMDDRITQLPVLALNEVFIGESVSARVSYLEMMINNAPKVTKLKSSGLCVATGTGSTSWHYSINRLPTETVAELLRVVDLDSGTTSGKDLAKKVADVYNENLKFRADDSRMAFTIRDLISAGVWPSPKGIQPCGFASQIRVKSRCFDAGLVIDGNVSYPFNDGAIAQLEIDPEDALRTVVIKD